MSIEIHALTPEEVQRLLGKDEGHFFDYKGHRIKPAKLSKTLSAFANADGGELLIGVEQQGGATSWDGFPNQEAANGHIQLFESLFPLSGDFRYEFLRADDQPGLVLRASVLKTRDVKNASDGIAYIRRGAQSLPVQDPDSLLRLRQAKGLVSHEDSTVAVTPDLVTNSAVVIEFMLEVVPSAEPLDWLRKQQVIIDAHPTVAGLLLYAEEPQAVLPKAGIKIYRYRTSDQAGTRDQLAFLPLTVEGCIYNQIRSAVAKTVEQTEKIQLLTPGGMQDIRYPRESLHEIITNAVLHRDYAVNDDVHVRIYDNRIEVESPGRLPAHITPRNILDERFARNPKIVRLVNKFPDPPNKDVGEGLNTAFEAMRRLHLRDPEIVERDNSVLVLVRHEQLASPAQLILEVVRETGSINNAEAREATGIQSEIKVRAILKQLVRARELEQIPGTFKATTRYRVHADRR